jgi:hypothetical protein
MTPYLIEISITTVGEMFPKFPSEIVSWVSIGDCGKSKTSKGGGGYRVYIFLDLFERWNKRISMVVIIPRNFFNANHFHNRFVGRKNLGNVAENKRQGIQPRWHQVGVG